jgi:hypothetical protein
VLRLGSRSQHYAANEFNGVYPMILDDRERNVIEMALRIALDQTMQAANACRRINDDVGAKEFTRHLHIYREMLAEIATQVDE